MGEAKEALMKALAAVDEFLGLHGAGEGEYAVGPHYGWSMTSVEQARGAGLRRVGGGRRGGITGEESAVGKRLLVGRCLTLLSWQLQQWPAAGLAKVQTAGQGLAKMQTVVSSCLGKMRSAVGCCGQHLLFSAGTCAQPPPPQHTLPPHPHRSLSWRVPPPTSTT